MTGNASSYRPELDALRTVAITIVLLHHYIDRPFALAGFGVMLFFVLSSYFGTRSLLQFKSHVETGRATPSDALKTFYGRRYLRIVPVHLLVLGLTALADVEYARSAFWWNAPFLSNVGMVWRDEWFGRFSPLWSLAVLEQFYFWWPAAVLRVPRSRLLRLIVLMIASASAWRVICWTFSLGPFYWTVVPLGTLDYVGFGALLALVRLEPVYGGVLKGIRAVGAWPCGLVLIALVGARFGGMVSVPYEVFWVSPVGSLFFVWLIDRSLRGIDGAPGTLLRNPILARSGRVSYSVFLLHNFTELLVPKIGVMGTLIDSDWRSLVLIPLTFGLAHAMWTYIEVPIAHVRRNHFHLRNAPGAATESLSPAGQPYG